MPTKDSVIIDIIADTKKSISNFAKFSAAIGIGIMAVRKLNAVMKEMESAFFEQEKAEAKLNAALMATNYQVGISKTELEGMATELANATTLTDQAVLAAQGLMTTFTQISGDVFPQAIEAAADMSTMFGQDLQQSVIQLGTALNDPIRGVGRLRRIGISFTQDQKDSIKAFMDQNDIMSAQQVILDELRVEFGGVAREMGETAYGASEKFKNAMTDLKEVMGRDIAEATTGFRERLTGLIHKMIEAGEEARNLKLATNGIFIESNTENLMAAKTAAEEQLAVYESAYTTALERMKEGPIKRAMRAISDMTVIRSDEYYERQIRAFEAQINATSRYIKTLENAITPANQLSAAEMLALDDMEKKLSVYAELDQAIVTITTKESYLGDQYDHNKALMDAYNKALDTFASFGWEKEYPAMVEFFEIYGSTVEDITTALDEMEKAELRAQKAIKGETINKVVGKAEIENQISLVNTLAFAFEEGLGGAIGSVEDREKQFADITSENLEKMKADYEDLAMTIYSTAAPALEALGGVLVSQEKAGEKFKEAIKGVIADVIRIYAKQWALLAAGALVPGPTFNPAAAIGYGAASAAATVGAGMIEAMGTGGIVTQPTLALIGERGPEAVVPLNRGMGNINITVNGHLLTDDMLQGFIANTITQMHRGY